jgi:hypothetical protein
LFQIVVANWTYQREITVSSTGSALSDFQVLVTLNDSNFSYDKSQGTDGRDIRFSTSNSGNVTPDIDYWIEEWNENGTSKIWLEIPSIPASGDTSVYLYYGNSSANSESNGNNTFIVFDDFEDGNADGWTVSRGTWNVVDDAGNYVYQTTHSTPSSDADHYVYINNPTFSDLIYEADINTVSTSDNYGNGALIFRQDIKGEYDPAIDNVKFHLAGVGDIANASYATNNDEWYKVKVKAGGTSLQLYINDSNVLSTTSSAGTSPGTIGLVVWEANVKFDNPRVRKYSSTEPTTSVGSEVFGDFPCPVSLVSFDACCNIGTVCLSWYTASETNNARFLVYRNNEVIASIEGSGTTSEPHNYEYIDEQVIPGNTYTYVLSDVSYANEETKYIDKAVTITIPEYDIPTEFALDNNKPNPLNPTTTISYELPQAQNIKLLIFDITGRLVETLYNGYKEAGHWDVTWNASDQSSGVYIYRLQAGDRCISKKMVVLK